MLQWDATVDFHLKSTHQRDYTSLTWSNELQQWSFEALLLGRGGFKLTTYESRRDL